GGGGGGRPARRALHPLRVPPQRDIGLDEPGRSNGDGVVSSDRNLARDVPRADALVQVALDLRGEVVVELGPHLRLLQVRVHSGKRRRHGVTSRTTPRKELHPSAFIYPPLKERESSWSIPTAIIPGDRLATSGAR